MNRDVSRGSDALQPAPSSNYLIYLFVISAAVVIFFPYFFPIGSTLLRWSNKKADVISKVKTDSYKRSSSSAYNSPSTNGLMQHVHYSESKCDALEAMVIDLQHVVQMEREKILYLENEIRILQIQERFLKDRVQTLEVRSVESRRDTMASHTPIDVLMRNTILTQSKQENLDTLVLDLLRMVQTEKDRTTALELEIGRLRKSETILIDRVKALEEKFSEFMNGQHKPNVNDGKNEQERSIRS